ncbi:MAG: tRNA epoxyqueuosine(34) reductase QueG [Proteobacteria bacterium]|nr:MAG: tRNA epoxyqueuosine(34) reductase QueG [Pseudomonadota bacterium]
MNSSTPTSHTRPSPLQLVKKIQAWGQELGFQQVDISDTELTYDEHHLRRWLALQRHGEMGYMIKHGTKRSRPSELVTKTVTVIAARMNYLTGLSADAEDVLNDPNAAYVSRYALGRDYHKLIRARLKELARNISEEIGDFGYRVFTDSAPVLERALARKAGLGWFGKHSNLINRHDGSWFFLGEIYTDMPLPPNREIEQDHCGRCVACIDVCPTKAIVAPYEVDARRCISYLTIEYRGVIPEEFRTLIGNRIFGCDDCQLVCPWNRFAKLSAEKDFEPRHRLDSSSLIELFEWSEAEFLARTEGSAIRRIKYEQWQRNLAVSLGNAPTSRTVREVLEKRLPGATSLVAEHIRWAIRQHKDRFTPAGSTPD